VTQLKNHDFRVYDDILLTNITILLSRIVISLFKILTTTLRLEKENVKKKRQLGKTNGG